MISMPPTIFSVASSTSFAVTARARQRLGQHEHELGFAARMDQLAERTGCPASSTDDAGTQP